MMVETRPRKTSLWRTVKAVAWSFVGLRARGDYEEDVKNLSPLHIIAVGLVAIFVFVAVLVLLVNWAVAR
jgi:predicted Na+-dependent transporter